MGGGIELSALKKLDRLLPLLPAGEAGTCDRLSIVLSDNDGRTFLGAGATTGAVSTGLISSSNADSGSGSRSPALEDDRNASKSPNTSLSCARLVDVVDDRGVALVCRDGGRPMGFLNTVVLLVEFRA